MWNKKIKDMEKIKRPPVFNKTFRHGEIYGNIEGVEPICINGKKGCKFHTCLMASNKTEIQYNGKLDQ